MELASTVIKDILQECTVQASEQAVQAVDSNTVIRYMNRWMASITTQGVNIGYTVVNNPTDPITVPDAAVEGIVFNVAKRIINSYDIPLKPELDMAARDGFKAMLRLSVKIVATKPPCTLPIGSGNESDSQYLTDHFYPCDDDVIATELGGSIQLESGTNEQ